MSETHAPFVGSRTRNLRIDYGYYALTDETLVNMAREALTRPSDAAFWDDDLYTTHTLMFYWAPDSDDMVSQSNYRTILGDMSDAYRRSPGAIETASIGHWTYSRFNCIKVRVLYGNGEIHPAFADAAQIAIALRDSYPLYSDDDHSELESEAWSDAIIREIDYQSDGDWSQVKRELVQDYLWEYVAYHHEVGYIPDEGMDAAIVWADSEISRVVALGVPETFAGAHYSEPLAGI